MEGGHDDFWAHSRKGTPMNDAGSTGRPRGLAPVSLRTTQLVACLLLILDYLLGMATNLLVTIPAQHPGAKAGHYFAGVADGIAWVMAHGEFWLVLHASLSLLLVVAALFVAATASRTGGRAAAVTSGIAALAILGAGFSGVSFLNYGGSFSSMIMAGLWAVALGCYLAGLFLSGRHDPVKADKPS